MTKKFNVRENPAYKEDSTAKPWGIFIDDDDREAETPIQTMTSKSAAKKRAAEYQRRADTSNENLSRFAKKMF